MSVSKNSTMDEHIQHHYDQFVENVLKPLEQAADDEFREEMTACIQHIMEGVPEWMKGGIEQFADELDEIAHQRGCTFAEKAFRAGRHAMLVELGMVPSSGLS